MRIAKCNLQISALSLLLILFGCAGLDVERVTPSNDAQAKGFRYFEPAPFLFVHSDGKGGLTGEVIFLPDTSRRMSIRPYAYLASNDATLNFTNGTLSEAKAQADETVVPMAIIDTVASLAKAAIGANAIRTNAVGSRSIAARPTKAPPPYLYRIIVRNDGIVLRGGPPEGPDIFLPNPS